MAVFLKYTLLNMGTGTISFAEQLSLGSSPDFCLLLDILYVLFCITDFNILVILVKANS